MRVNVSKFYFFFLFIPILLPVLLSSSNINTSQIINYRVPSFLMIFLTFVIIPKIKDNIINSGVILLMNLFSYLISYLIYEGELNIIIIVLPFLFTLIIFLLLRQYALNITRLVIQNKDVFLIVFWVFYIVSYSIVSSIEIGRLVSFWSLLPVFLLSVAIGWYGKKRIFDSLSGEYMYVKVLFIPLFLLIFSFIYDVFMGDVLGRRDIAWDAPSVWILSVLSVTSILMSKTCYEVYVRSGSR
jgi:hypothetical protein